MVCSSIRLDARPSIRGKFLFSGEEKFYLRGVTYGPFRPDENGSEYRDQAFVEKDFARMAANGINAVRTYTVPPRWLFDVAQRHGLYVMVGLPWEQHVTFLDDRRRARSIEKRVRAAVRACAGHPAVLCYAIGNEIPSQIVRWHGHRRVERYLDRLHQVAKAQDPAGLFTYVNYPSTEYLELPFVDLVCFNVYIESQECLDTYVARLHNIAGDRPLIMSEIGLDSRRHSEDIQASALDWQVRTVFAAGCAGAFVFAWTDEWHRGGYDIEDWDFGITSRDQSPKPALGAVRKAFAESPFRRNLHWPRISVVVCSHNGARTIRDCLQGLLKLDYPDFEAIVVDDGSTDGTPEIVREYGFRLISTKNRGLSNARNTGLEAATGEMVAYIDDDAYPDPHWLTYLATAFERATYVGVGGPNIAPPGDGFVADCIARSPGGPVHVLLSDREAEHIPGCNMAFRKAAHQAIGGSDPQFRIAGDDVDVCWRIQQRGWKLGFSPAAVVWHHRRNSVRAYWRQQRNYGKAEAMLERKWPDKYNGAGHLAWAGRVYGVGLPCTLGKGARIYHGTWGTAPFQSLYHPAPGLLQSMLLMPEWNMIIIVLAGLSILSTLWTPLRYALPLLALAVAALLAQAAMSAARVSFTPGPRLARLKLQSLTAFLHLLQPLARLSGRLYYRLTPWQGGAVGLSRICPRTFTIWSEQWRASPERLLSLEATLRVKGVVVMRGGDYDRWDLEVRGGAFGAARLRMAIEEHGAGKQLLRFRTWPRASTLGIVLVLVFAVFASLAGRALLDRAWGASTILGIAALVFALVDLRDCAAAMAVFERGLCGQR